MPEKNDINCNVMETMFFSYCNITETSKVSIKYILR